MWTLTVFRRHDDEFVFAADLPALDPCIVRSILAVEDDVDVSGEWEVEGEALERLEGHAALPVERSDLRFFLGLSADAAEEH